MNTLNTPSRPLRRIGNALGWISDVTRERGVPVTLGIGVAQRAVAEVRTRVAEPAKQTHAEVIDIAGDLDAMLADGQIDAGECARLKRHRSTLHRCARRSHDISEAVAA